MVCVLPNESVTVTVTTAPTSPEPVMVGVLSFPVPGASTVSNGAKVSMLPEPDTEALLPESSELVALTVKLPSARSMGTSTLKLPEPSTVVVTVCVAPAASVTVSVTVAPTSPVPVNVGVASFPRPGGSSVNVGAALLTSAVTVWVDVLPAPSSAMTVTVYSPSANASGTSML